MPPKIQIIGNEDTAIPYLQWAKKQWNRRGGTWYAQPETACLIQFHRFGEYGFIRFIITATPGFAFHPRTSEYPNGANTKLIGSDGRFEPLPAKVITEEDEEGNSFVRLINVMFPLFDGDHGTMTLSLEEGKAEVEKRPEGEDYGIIAWLNEDAVMSWRGWPAITLGCDRSVYIDGVSSVDSQTQFATYYTPLANKLYNSGLITNVPGNLKGAGLSQHGLVVVVTCRYMTNDFAGFDEAVTNPVGEDWMYDNKVDYIPENEKAGKVGNYFDELYLYVGNDYTYYVSNRIKKARSDGWIRLGYRLSLLDNLAVWFSEDGFKAEEDAGTWAWAFYPSPNNDLGKTQGAFSCTFDERVDMDLPHQYTVYGFDPFRIPGKTVEWKVTSSTRWQCMYKHAHHGEISYYRDDSTKVYIKPVIDTTEETRLYQSPRPDPAYNYINWNYPPTMPDNKYTITFSAVQFKSGPFTWSGATVDPGSNTYTASVSGDVKCVASGTPPVSKTVTVTDNCGFTSSVTYNVPTKIGSWIIDDVGHCDFAGISGGYVVWTGGENEYTEDTWTVWGTFTAVVQNPPLTWSCGPNSNFGGVILHTITDQYGTAVVVGQGYTRYKLVCDD